MSVDDGRDMMVRDKYFFADSASVNFYSPLPHQFHIGSFIKKLKLTLILSRKSNKKLSINGGGYNCSISVMCDSFSL